VLEDRELPQRKRQAARRKNRGSESVTADAIVVDCHFAKCDAIKGNYAMYLHQHFESLFRVPRAL
jgi:hypothetical protein